MADFPSIGGDNLVQNFLQQQQAAQESDKQDKAADDRADDQVQHAITQKAQQHKQNVANKQAAQQTTREEFSHEQRAGRAWQQMAEGKNGPELMQLAQSPNLQQKLNDKVKAMFVEAAQQDPARAAQAANVLTAAAESPGFQQAAPNARMASEFAGRVLERPALSANVQEAMQAKFMKSADGDAGAKQGLLRFASRQVGMTSPTSTGVSVRMGGDMLDGLRQARVPGFGQRAAMDMIERNPDNSRGVTTMDKFVREASVQQMPAQARGEAVKTLAKGDGAPELGESLTNVSQAEAFRALGREDKGRLFSTIGQGRPTELRAISDKTLETLRSNRFPTDAGQVNKFLGGLSRQIQKGDGSSKEINGKGLLRDARGSDMPKPPQLRAISGLSDEERDAARKGNNAKLQKYYSELASSYKQTGQHIANAQHFLDANKQIVKPPEEPDLSGFGVDEKTSAAIDKEIAKAFEPDANGRQIARAEQLKRLDQIKASFLGRKDLTEDQKDFAATKARHAIATTTFTDLSIKKNQKVRLLRSTIGKPSPASAKAAREKRPSGPQRRYFTPSGSQQALGRTAVRMPGANAGREEQVPRGGPSLPGGTANRAQQRMGNAQAAPQRQGGAATARAAVSRADVKQLVAQLDPSLSMSERIQQATEMISQSISQRMQQELREAASMVADELTGGLAAEGESGTMGARAGEPGAKASTARNAPTAKMTTGTRDGYGIPRTAERDLGARANFQPVRAPQQRTKESSGEEKTSSSSTKRDRDIIRANTQVRTYDQLYQTPFKDMSKGETALLRSLDWNATSWASKNEPNAQWPMAYSKSFSELARREQQAVRQLKISPDDWDAQAAAFNKAK